VVPQQLLGRATWVLVQNDSATGIERLLEFSTLSVLIAVLALPIMVAIWFAVFLFGFVRLVARR